MFFFYSRPDISNKIQTTQMHLKYIYSKTLHTRVNKRHIKPDYEARLM